MQFEDIKLAEDPKADVRRVVRKNNQILTGMRFGSRSTSICGSLGSVICSQRVSFCILCLLAHVFSEGLARHFTKREFLT
jgi:hypothetical protein